MKHHDPNYSKTRNIIKYQLFPHLRRLGFIARMNFSCCGSCGSYELTQDAKRRNKKRVVFYHRQAEDFFKLDGKVNLLYFSMDDDEEQTKIAGDIIAEVAKYYDLKVTWDGSPTKTILLSCKE